MSSHEKLRKRAPFLGFAGCFIIGTVVGIIWDNITAGMLIGLGSGFIVMALGRFFLRRRKSDEGGSGDTEGGT